MPLPPRDNFRHKTLDYLIDSFSIYALHLRFSYEVKANVPSFVTRALSACLHRMSYAQTGAALFLLQDSFFTLQVGISLFDLPTQNSTSCS